MCHYIYGVCKFEISFLGEIMKKYLWLILVFAFVGMNAQNLDSLIDVSGWEDFDGYKKQKLIIGDITYRQISKDKTKLFTADSNKYFKLWDLETGKLIESINIEHQLPVFLLNDTLILFRASTKNPNYQKNVYGYSLNDNIEYAYLEHEFYDNKDVDLFISYSSIQLISDTVIKFPKEINNYDFTNETKYLSGKTFSINSKIEIKDYIKMENFNNITYIDKSNYYADIISYDKYKGFEINYFFSVGFYNNIKPVNISFNGNPPNNFRSMISDINNNKLFVCEANKFYVIDTKLKTTLKNQTLIDTLTSICLLDSNSIVAYNNQKKRILAYNWKNELYNYYYMISNNYLNKMVYLKDRSEFIITNNGGEIYLLSDSVFNQKNVTFEMEAKEWLMQKQVKFTNFSALTFDSFYWNFGDGEGSTELNPYHVFKKEGKYKIELTGIKNGFFSSYTDSIIVLPNYYPSFEIDKSYGEAPLKVKFKNTSSFDADSVIWEFGKNAQSAQNIEEGEITFYEAKKDTIFLKAYKAGSIFQTSKIIDIYQSDTNNIVSVQIDAKTYYYVSQPSYVAGTSHRFYKYVLSSDNNLYYSYLNIDISYYAGASKNVETNYLSTYKINYFNKRIPINYNSSNIFSYTDGGLFVLWNDSIEVFDRNLDILFKIKNDKKYQNFLTIDNKYILAKNNNNIAFFNKYFIIQKEYSISDFTNKDVDSITNIQLFQSANKYHSNSNSYVILQSNSKKLTIVEFKDKNVNQKFTLDNLELASYNITNDNELCLISKSGVLKILNLNNCMLKEYQNYNFSNCHYFDKNILYEVKGDLKDQPEGLSVKFIDFDGNLLYQYHTLINTNSENSVLYLNFNNLYKSFDNKIYILTGNPYYPCFALISLYFKKNLSPSGINISKNSNSHLFPNPTSDYININNGEIQNIKIYDMRGIEINYKAEFFGNLVRINVSDLQTGMYVVRYELQGKIYNEKFVKY